MKIKCTFHIAIAFILIQLTDEFSIAFAYGICEKNPYVRILYVTFAILSLLTMIYLYTKYIIRIQMQDLFLGMPLPKKKWCITAVLMPVLICLFYIFFTKIHERWGDEMKIAIIEDDKITRLELSKLLNSHGYETVLLTDFENLSEESKKYSFDLILLDINLPYENGYEICRKMKKLMSVPIIFVTSRDTSADELLSIQAGGIDFITKPYDTLILLEKIKRALQLSNPNNFRELTKKDCTLDLHLSVLKYEGKSIELTRNEFRILYYFFMNEDKIISKEELLEKLWNDKYYLDENVLLVNMTRLKKKMKEIGIIHLLENIRGKGWKL